IHGSGVACWRGLGDGKLARAVARLHERHSSRLLGYRLRLVERHLWPLLQLYRLAWHAVAPRPPPAGPGPFASPPQGTRNLARKSSAAAHSKPRGSRAADQHLQARVAVEHAFGLLVDGGQLRSLLLADRAVRDPSAKGSGVEPSACRHTFPAVQPGRICSDGFLGVGWRRFGPALVDDHSGGNRGAVGTDL